MIHVKIILTSLFLMAVSCSKDKQTPLSTLDEKPVTALLTRKEWKLISYGYDDNENGQIDPAEESIAECETDNTYLFKVNGTGSYFENALACTNGITENSFTWKLNTQETELDFLYGKARILRLNENEMALYHLQLRVNGQPVKFVLIYRH